jgi:hypothetical protein
LNYNNFLSFLWVFSKFLWVFKYWSWFFEMQLAVPLIFEDGYWLRLTIGLEWAPTESSWWTLVSTDGIILMDFSEHRRNHRDGHQWEWTGSSKDFNEHRQDHRMEQDHRNGNFNNNFYFSAFLSFPPRVPLLSLKKSHKSL